MSHVDGGPEGVSRDVNKGPTDTSFLFLYRSERFPIFSVETRLQFGIFNLIKESPRPPWVGLSKQVKVVHLPVVVSRLFLSPGPRMVSPVNKSNNPDMFWVYSDLLLTCNSGWISPLLLLTSKPRSTPLNDSFSHVGDRCPYVDNCVVYGKEAKDNFFYWPSLNRGVQKGTLVLLRGRRNSIILRVPRTNKTIGYLVVHTREGVIVTRVTCAIPFEG